VDTQIWSAPWPRILGAVLDAVSAALHNLANVKLEAIPRMADFAKWITAAESGLGWESGEFLAAYRENRRDVSEAAFEADSVAVAIDKVISTERPEGFHGTATELLSAINNMVPETTRKSKYWPQNAAQLGMARATPLLRAKGYIVERRHSGTRTITIVPPKRACTMGQTASAPPRLKDLALAGVVRDPKIRELPSTSVPTKPH
jgi:putative DNA primase/helicase